VGHDSTADPGRSAKDRGLSPEVLAGMHRYQAEVAEEEGDDERAAFHRDLAKIHDRKSATAAEPEPPLARRPWGRRKPKR
jgi:hypothetical protein